MSQPHYQRWETGKTPIPDAQLKNLAKILKTTPEDLATKSAAVLPPDREKADPDSVKAFLAYYGEVAIHFRGGGSPLLLSITSDAYRRVHSDLQHAMHFITIQTMANQTVIVRTDAVSDIYLSDDAVDTFGPEHKTYDLAFVQPVFLPKPHDWRIVEAISDELGGVDSDELEEFDPADVKRVKEAIMITDEQYEQLIANGSIKARDLKKERSKNQIETNRIIGLAVTMTYQLSSGHRRTLRADDPVALYNAVWPLTDFGEDMPDGMIRVEQEEGCQIAFINANALDYITVPTHKFEYGRENGDEE